MVGELVGFLVLLPIPFFEAFAMVGMAVVAALDGLAVEAAQLAGRLSIPVPYWPHSLSVLQQLFIFDVFKVCTTLPDYCMLVWHHMS